MLKCMHIYSPNHIYMSRFRLIFALTFIFEIDTYVYIYIYICTHTLHIPTRCFGIKAVVLLEVQVNRADNLGGILVHKLPTC